MLKIYKIVKERFKCNKQIKDILIAYPYTINEAFTAFGPEKASLSLKTPPR